MSHFETASSLKTIYWRQYMVEHRAGGGGMIKKFYYLMVLSGLMLIFQNMSTPEIFKGVENYVPEENLIIPEEQTYNYNEVHYDPVTDLYYYQGEKYVLINGQYYLHREDNVYDVDEYRYLYKPEPKSSVKKLSKSLRAPDKEMQISSGGAASGANLAQIFTSLKNSKKRIEEQRRILDELASME